MTFQTFQFLFSITTTTTIRVDRSRALLLLLWMLYSRLHFLGAYTSYTSSIHQPIQPLQPIEYIIHYEHKKKITEAPNKKAQKQAQTKEQISFPMWYKRTRSIRVDSRGRSRDTRAKVGNRRSICSPASVCFGFGLGFLCTRGLRDSALWGQAFK